MELEELNSLSRDEIGALRCHGFTTVESIVDSDEEEAQKVLGCTWPDAAEVIQEALSAIEENPFSNGSAYNSVDGLNLPETPKCWSQSIRDDQVMWETENSVYEVRLRPGNERYTVSTTVPEDIEERSAEYVLRCKGYRRIFSRKSEKNLHNKLKKWLWRNQVSGESNLRNLNNVSDVKEQYFDLKHDITTIEELYQFSEENPMLLTEVFRNSVWNIRDQLEEKMNEQSF